VRIGFQIPKLAIGFGANKLSFRNLSFLICKMEVIMAKEMIEFRGKFYFHHENQNLRGESVQSWPNIFNHSIKKTHTPDLLSSSSHYC
jgi:hypothetical protein